MHRLAGLRQTCPCSYRKCCWTSDNFIWKYARHASYILIYASYRNLDVVEVKLKLRWTHVISQMPQAERHSHRSGKGTHTHQVTKGRTSHAFNAICKALLQLDLAHAKACKHPSAIFWDSEISKIDSLILSCIVDNKNVALTQKLLLLRHEVGAWPCHREYRPMPVGPVRSS